MRPAREAAAALVGVGSNEQATAAAAGHVGHAALWRTPTPYLFIGFTLMMGLIAVALLILVCTRPKPSAGSSRRGSATEDASARGTIMAPLDREPKFVVIMAGDHMPSFIARARPLAFATAADAGEQSKMEVA